MTLAGAILHASCVAVDGRGLLILGPSGAGKSALALRLLSLGARLVADDRTQVHAADGQLTATCPNPALRGLIEARGIGILHAPALDSAPLVLAVDLAQSEDQRLPPRRSLALLGCTLPLVLSGQGDHLAPALLLHLRHGRHA